MTSSDVITYLNNGLAIVILVVLTLGARQGSIWFGSNIVVPMKDAAITHLNKTGEALEKNATATKDLSNAMQQMHTDVKEIKLSLKDTCVHQKSQM